MYLVKLRAVNNLLLLAIIVVNGYVILAPIAPGLLFGVWNHGGARQRQLQSKVTTKTGQPVAPASGAQQPNEVIIPSMLLDQPVLEGPQSDMYRILDKGIWHWPLSSTPDKGGNTVLLGHRFTYTNPRGVLYFLNKVKVGDTIGVTWSRARYVYTVTRIHTVPPTDTTVTAPTDKPTLTIYTCTPLWQPHDRLVVTAELEKNTRDKL